MIAAYSDGAELYAALANAPEEGSIRAAWYDWTQEFDPARWDFVRVQTELEELPPPPNYDSPSRPIWTAMECGLRYLQLESRESELLAAHRAEWLQGPICQKCSGCGDIPLSQYSSDVSCPRLPCSVCHGSGDASGLTWKFEYRGGAERSLGPPTPVRVTFRRGLPYRVECPRLSDAVMEQRIGMAMHGPDPTRTVPTPWLRAVTTSHPVEEVVPLDARPFIYQMSGSILWNWWENRAHDTDVTGVLCAPLFELIWELAATGSDGCIRHHDVIGRWVSCQSEKIAIAALGRCVATFGRRNPT